MNNGSLAKHIRAHGLCEAIGGLDGDEELLAQGIILSALDAQHSAPPEGAMIAMELQVMKRLNAILTTPPNLEQSGSTEAWAFGVQECMDAVQHEFLHPSPPQKSEGST